MDKENKSEITNVADVHWHLPLITALVRQKQGQEGFCKDEASLTCMHMYVCVYNICLHIHTHIITYLPIWERIRCSPHLTSVNKILTLKDLNVHIKSFSKNIQGKTKKMALILRGKE